MVALMNQFVMLVLVALSNLVLLVVARWLVVAHAHTHEGVQPTLAERSAARHKQ